MISESVIFPRVAAVPSETFWMGESADDKFANDTERPRHRVSFAHRFAIGVYPVTVDEYQAFDPSHAPSDCPRWPVVDVSWQNASAYCAWLAEQTGKTFRLPSEAEWECACRAGTDTCFSTGEDISPAQANFLYSESGERIGIGRREEVGAYSENQYGLHDFHGNVSEMTADAWHATYIGAPVDGSAWTVGGASDRRVIRGGGWDYLPRLLRSTWRDSIHLRERRDNVGFRVALTLP